MAPSSKFNKPSSANLFFNFCATNYSDKFENDLYGFTIRKFDLILSYSFFLSFIQSPCDGNDTEYEQENGHNDEMNMTMLVDIY